MANIRQVPCCGHATCSFCLGRGYFMHPDDLKAFSQTVAWGWDSAKQPKFNTLEEYQRLAVDV